jgi:hypothetical protein
VGCGFFVVNVMLLALHSAFGLCILFWWICNLKQQYEMKNHLHSALYTHDI